MMSGQFVSEALVKSSLAQVTGLHFGVLGSLTEEETILLERKLCVVAYFHCQKNSLLTLASQTYDKTKEDHEAMLMTVSNHYER